MMTKEQYNILKQYEKHFSTARYGYVRGIYSSDIQLVSPIYAQLGYKLSNPNCGECILVMFKNLGIEYNKYINNKNERTEKKNKGL